MIILAKNDNEYAYGIKKFILDNIEDLKQLPTNVTMGSTALIIETNETYMLDSKK